jgi:hypothetical protein
MPLNIALANARKDIRKDKEKQQRLHHNAHDERADLAAQHAQVAQQQAPKGGSEGCALLIDGGRAIHAGLSR